MTAAAGASERERLSDLIHASHRKWCLLDKRCPEAGQVADALIAEGFGDVARAKAEGMEEAAAFNDAEAATFPGGDNEEGWPAWSLNHSTERICARAAEYRTPSANGCEE